MMRTAPHRLPVPAPPQRISDLRAELRRLEPDPHQAERSSQERSRPTQDPLDAAFEAQLETQQARERERAAEVKAELAELEAPIATDSSTTALLPGCRCIGPELRPNYDPEIASLV